MLKICLFGLYLKQFYMLEFEFDINEFWVNSFGCCEEINNMWLFQVYIQALFLVYLYNNF